MASRRSVLRAHPRQALTDESVHLVRWCGLLVRVTLATLTYEYVLKECLPGQYALVFLSTLYGISVIQLLPGASTPRGFAKWLALIARVIPRKFKINRDIGLGPDDRSDRAPATRSGERSRDFTSSIDKSRVSTRRPSILAQSQADDINSTDSSSSSHRHSKRNRSNSTQGGKSSKTYTNNSNRNEATRTSNHN
jgi:hypothetical protein